MSSLTIRHLVMGLAGLVVLAVVNFTIFQTESRLTQGQVIYLSLAPVDPRSLIQGDYMQLNYALTQELRNLSELPEKGKVVLSLDEQNIATFERLYQGEPLAANEILLNYRQWDSWNISIGPDSFFFEEGRADDYANARYAAFRVADNGQSMLINLHDEDLRPLGPDHFN
jgi:uncharacterized membrane-anchored protein